MIKFERCNGILNTTFINRTKTRMSSKEETLSLVQRLRVQTTNYFYSIFSFAFFIQILRAKLEPLFHNPFILAPAAYANIKGRFPFNGLLAGNSGILKISCREGFHWTTLAQIMIKELIFKISSRNLSFCLTSKLHFFYVLS